MLRKYISVSLKYCDYFLAQKNFLFVGHFFRIMILESIYSFQKISITGIEKQYAGFIGLILGICD